MNYTTTSTFEFIDYAVFSTFLMLSALIGLYFGFCGKKQDSPEEYLHGGKQMKILPIAASLIASDVSGILILGAPSDTYFYGTFFGWSILASFLSNIGVIYLFLPVFYNLQLTSCFEYLKMRFSSRIRAIASGIYTFNQLMYMPIVMYTSVLAFGQVSKVNMNFLTIIVCIICIVYTTIGGIKAVVWTDTLQMGAMVGSLIVVLGLGIIVQDGGLKEIFETSMATGRIDTRFSFDPTDRTAAGTVLIGLTIYQMSNGCNPMYVQRFLALPSEKKTKISVHLLSVGILVFRVLTISLGLLIYTRYVNCDPISSGSIQKMDQIVPYYIMDVASSLPGLPGIFIAGVFCAALSTMSSFLNTLSGTIYDDFIKDHMPINTTKKRASDLMKVIVSVLGVISMCLVFIVQHLGGILELTFMLRGVVTGPVMGQFAIGMLFPNVNEKGILYGSIGSTLFMSWIAIGAKYYTLTGKISTPKLPLSTEGCLIVSNITAITNSTKTFEDDISEPFYLYRIAIFYYCFLGVMVTLLIALPISWLTTKKKEIIDTNLFSPIVYKFISKHNHEIRLGALKNDKELEHLNKKIMINS